MYVAVRRITYTSMCPHNPSMCIQWRIRKHAPKQISAGHKYLALPIWSTLLPQRKQFTEAINNLIYIKLGKESLKYATFSWEDRYLGLFHQSTHVWYMVVYEKKQHYMNSIKQDSKKNSANAVTLPMQQHYWDCTYMLSWFLFLLPILIDRFWILTSIYLIQSTWTKHTSFLFLNPIPHIHTSHTYEKTNIHSSNLSPQFCDILRTSFLSFVADQALKIIISGWSTICKILISLLHAHTLSITHDTYDHSAYINDDILHLLFNYTARRANGSS